MVRFILRALIAALGFWVASKIVPGVHVASWVSLMLAGLVLGIVNALVRPIIVLLTLPFTIITLGLFLLVVNGISVSLVVFFIHGVKIDTFWHAVLVAIVIAITGWIGSWFLGSADAERRR